MFEWFTITMIFKIRKNPIFGKTPQYESTYNPMHQPQINEIGFFFIKIYSMHLCICVMCRPEAGKIAHASTYNSMTRHMAARMSVLSFAALFDNFGCNFRSVSPNETPFEAFES